MIGAGIGGLACSVRLVAKGYSVTVFEANEVAGGKLTEIKNGGFRFDAGPSLFTMPELVDELFGLFSPNLLSVKYQRLENICNYFYPDGTCFSASSNPDQFAKDAARVTGASENKIKKHLGKSRFIYNATGFLFLEKSLHKFRSYCSFKVFTSLLKLPFLSVLTTMNSVNKRRLENEKMVQLFNRYATYNGSNPFKAPGILNIIPHLEFSKGAFFPEGGMIEITNSIYQLATSKGVEFNFNQKVDQIIVEGGVAKGVVVHGKSYLADQVICNMDVYHAYTKLMPSQPISSKKLNQERSSSALIFYWGVKGSFENLDLHNIFFSGNYAAEFQAIFEEKKVIDDPTIYVNISSKKSSSDAPEGHENWFVMINVPSNVGQDWDTLIEKARKDIILKLNRMMKIDLESLIVTENMLDPRLIESNTQSYQGSLYGTASNSRMAAFFRHPNFSKKIKNLYFCGGSVHPGGGIPLALSSAKIVDSFIRPVN
ncbi:MAG: phytoene desaturase [Parvicellaceae bacterium]